MWIYFGFEKNKIYEYILPNYINDVHSYVNSDLTLDFDVNGSMSLIKREVNVAMWNTVSSD